MTNIIARQNARDARERVPFLVPFFSSVSCTIEIKVNGAKTLAKVSLLHFNGGKEKRKTLEKMQVNVNKDIIPYSLLIRSMLHPLFLEIIRRK